MRNVLALAGLLVAASAVVLALGSSFGGRPAVGTLLDPVDGLYHTARSARKPERADLRLPALEHPVTVIRDDRGVPHIFAATDRDAVTALGYAVAEDRLFQLDLLPRAVSGRLAEVLGPGALEVDRFFRATGIDRAARENLARIRQEHGVEEQLLDWFAAGVNAYLDAIGPEDLPFEMRILGYRPGPYTPLESLRLLQYMSFDLTYRSDSPEYAELERALQDTSYRALFPRHAALSEPIVPAGTAPVRADTAARMAAEAGRRELARLAEFVPRIVRERFVEGKGSNNWAVSGRRSATGSPILAGDMHLELTLPAIWYEVHLVTPTMNSYGVTIPGAPLPVEAFNDFVGWTFTNTGADQIDHYAIELDPAGRRYRCGDGWCDLELRPDTILVRGEAPRVDTLRYSRWGPVLTDSTGRMAVRDGRAVSIQWTAHKTSRTLEALWWMNQARDARQFQTALRYWDTPMQNILYADVHGNISIRSTGHLPVRREGHGAGLLDGTTDRFAWTGRVPFEELPHAENPEQGYLASANQEPVGASYPHYLGHDWRAGFRSLRINALLRSREQHSVEDLKRYQADVYVVQRDLFVPLLAGLTGLDPESERLREMLGAWNGEARADSPEPLVLDILLDNLRRLAWDEFKDLRRPGTAQLWRLLHDEPASPWLDVRGTPARESGPELLRLALQSTADSLHSAFGPDPAAWRWGDHHRIVFRHLTRNEALRPLWRGPFEYPGFAETLSPAGDTLTTHSASWRVVVDFSSTPPAGYGVYPGGQSGNPFSRRYDLHLPAYLSFQHFPLLKPATPDELPAAAETSRYRLNP